MELIKCPKCGSEMTDSKFCTVCGEKLSVSDSALQEAEHELLDKLREHEKTTGDPGTSVSHTDTPAPPRIQADERKQGHGPARVFMSVLLCIILFAFSFSALLHNLIRMSISDEAITETVSEIDIVTLMEEYEITEMIYASIPSEIVEAYDIRQSSLERLLEHPAVKEFASDKFSEYMSALAQGDSNFTLSKRDIIRFLEKNESIIQNETGYKLTSADYQKLDNYLSDSELLHEISINSILSTANTDPGLIKWALSTFAFIVLLILCAVTLFALIYLNRKHVRLAFLSIGITSCCLGLIYTILGLSLSNIILTAAGGSIKHSLINSILSYTMNTSLTYGLIILAIGLVLTGISVLLKKTAKQEN